MDDGERIAELGEALAWRARQAAAKLAEAHKARRVSGSPDVVARLLVEHLAEAVRTMGAAWLMDTTRRA